MSDPVPTIYYDDFLNYYQRAELLQKMNLGEIPRKSVGDPLQDNVPIYDTVNRRCAGFSKVLEDLWYAKRKWDCDRPSLSCEQWLRLFLIHRVTGSGASFEKDHGYRNNRLFELVKAATPTMDTCSLELFDKRVALQLHQMYVRKMPLFTSIGNQIPPFAKPSREFETGGIEYLIYDVPKVVDRFLRYLEANRDMQPFSIQLAVDCALETHSDLGFKKFHFVLTAFCMDAAEYFPTLVDPRSHCYYGKNCLEALDLMFEKTCKKGHHDRCIEILCEDTGNDEPMSIEDVACDYIRYLENYVPKAYRHLGRENLQNTSGIQHPNTHPWFASQLL